MFLNMIEMNLSKQFTMMSIGEIYVFRFQEKLANQCKHYKIKEIMRK